MLHSWSGIITLEGVQTGDSRVIAEGALYWENLPLPLRWAPTDEGGHMGAVDVGRIDTIERRPGGEIHGTGVIDDEVPYGADAVRLLGQGILRGVSIDPDDWQTIVVDTTITQAEADEAEAELMALFAAAGDPDPGDGPDAGVVLFEDEAGAIVERLVRGRIRGGTLVSIPAFDRAVVALDAATGDEDGDAEVVELDTPAADTADEDEQPAVAAAGSCGCGGICDPCADRHRAVVAARVTAEAPPAHVFENRELPQVSALRREGHLVFGHLADHSTCHVGILAACVTAPHSAAGYEPFHRYDRTRGGTPLPTLAGRITAGYGAYTDACSCCPGSDDHACIGLSYGAAIGHHDQLTDVAYIAAGEDDTNGAIWFAGIVNPDATPDELAILDRRMVSGDWRPYRSGLELTEVLALHGERPGYPVSLVAHGRVSAAVGAGMVTPGAHPGEAPAAIAAADRGFDPGQLASAVADELDRRAARPHRRALEATGRELARRRLTRLGR